MSTLSAHLEAVLWQAHGAALGLRIQTQDPVQLRSLLYVTRRRMERPELATLVIRSSPLNPERELWITHREAPAEAPEAAEAPAPQET